VARGCAKCKYLLERLKDHEYKGQENRWCEWQEGVSLSASECSDSVSKHVCARVIGFPV
jgi:hypothetical protein